MLCVRHLMLQFHIAINPLMRTMGQADTLTVLFLIQMLVISELSVHGRTVPEGHIELENADDVKVNSDDVEVVPETKVLDVDSYLERYGYLATPTEDPDHRRAYDEATRTQAIKDFQQFANLNQSGILDEETISAMRRPRCGVVDIQPDSDPTKPLEFNTGSTQWSSPTIHWKIGKYTDKLTEEQQRTAVEAAFHHWSSVSDINIEQTNSTAEIVLKFETGDHGDGKKNAFDGRGGVLGHAYPPEDGSAHFDQEEQWVLHNNQGTEFETVATHEVGHSLGLTHSTVRGSVMSPFSFPYYDGFTLHADDIAGIQSLYGPPTTTTTTTTPTTTTTLAPQAQPPTTQKPKKKKKSKKKKSKKRKQKKGSEDNNNNNTTGGTSNTSNPLCQTKFDAITRGPDAGINVFIGRDLYKLKEYCEEGYSCIMDGYPKPIKKVYKKGPSKVGAAAYIPDHRKRTYLFKGKKVWRFTEYKLDQGYPKTFNATNLPYKPSAAYVQKNQFADYQFYLFGSKHFWEMNLYTETIANEKMLVETYWDHVPKKPDAMLQTADGNIYVFKKEKYRKYDYLRGAIQKSKPIGPSWLGGDCGFYPR